MTPAQMKSAVGNAIDDFYRQIRQKTASGSARLASTGRGRKQSDSRKANHQTGRFVRDRLPVPLAYFEEIGLKPRGQSAWRMVRCVFHDDSHSSLSINVENGAFRCHACGTKGGDVLAFEQQLSGTDFKGAAQRLGAWA